MTLFNAVKCHLSTVAHGRQARGPASLLARVVYPSLDLTNGAATAEPLWVNRKHADMMEIHGARPTPVIVMVPKAQDTSNREIPLTPQVKRVTEIPDDDDDDDDSADGTPPAMPEGKPQADGHIPDRFTDVGNAKRLVSMFGHNIRFAGGSFWVAWNGTVWKRDADSYLYRYARQTAESYYLESRFAKSVHKAEAINRWWKKSESAGAQARMLLLAEKDPAVRIAVDELDANPYLFNCPNGTIDLRTGELRKHDRVDLITKLSPVAYDSDARALRWERFLTEIFAPSLELIPYVQKLIGYAMTGSTKNHVLPIFYGPTGRNGKTTLLERIRYVMGDYGITSDASTFMRRDNPNPEGATPGLTALAGTRFVQVSEIEEGHRLNVALIKNLTGDSTITARPLYKPKFEFKPTFKVFIVTNHFPGIPNGGDPAFWARVKPIPFDVSFRGREDVELPDTLATESVGILRWMVEGARLWHREGLGELPSSARTLLQTYQSEANPLADFIASVLDISETARALKRDVFAAFQTWSVAERQDTYRWDERRFGRELKRQILTIRDSNSSGRPTYKGIGIKSQSNANGVPTRLPRGMTAEIHKTLFGDNAND